jgi:hypothetical protein
MALPEGSGISREEVALAVEQASDGLISRL